MNEKNNDYQKNIREKRKNEGKKTLQIPASAENHEKFKEYRERYALKSQEIALEHMLNRIEMLELRDLEKKKPPTLRSWFIEIFARQGKDNNKF
jgi:hypothetical protein